MSKAKKIIISMILIILLLPFAVAGYDYIKPIMLKRYTRILRYKPIYK